MQVLILQANERLPQLPLPRLLRLDKLAQSAAQAVIVAAEGPLNSRLARASSRLRNAVPRQLAPQKVRQHRLQAQIAAAHFVLAGQPPIQQRLHHLRPAGKRQPGQGRFLLQLAGVLRQPTGIHHPHKGGQAGQQRLRFRVQVAVAVFHAAEDHLGRVHPGRALAQRRQHPGRALLLQVGQNHFHGQRVAIQQPH